MSNQADYNKPARPRSKKLRESAKHCPYCMGCTKPNPNGDILCLAHSNRQQDGKGMGKKSDDDKGAILCQSCHDYVDGRDGTGTRMMWQNAHFMAHERTVRWWKKMGYLE